MVDKIKLQRIAVCAYCKGIGRALNPKTDEFEQPRKIEMLDNNVIQVEFKDGGVYAGIMYTMRCPKHPNQAGPGPISYGTPPLITR